MNGGTVPQGSGHDGPGLVRRIRRAAELSQRDLADRIGVSRSAVGRWETGETSPTIAVLEQMAALAGLRVVLLDGDDHPVPPMREDRVLDRAGRRPPAHADVIEGEWWTPPGSHLTVEGILARRESERLGVVQVRWVTGTWKRVHRAATGTPADHPTHADLVSRLRDEDSRGRGGGTETPGGAPSVEK